MSIPIAPTVILQNIRISGLHVDDAPCVVIYDCSVNDLVYRSLENDDSIFWNETDEEAFYAPRVRLENDFLIYFRFGGDHCNDISDPSKVSSPH